MPNEDTVLDAKKREYLLRLQVNQLRLRIRDHPTTAHELWKLLAQVEQSLAEVEVRLDQAEKELDIAGIKSAETRPPLPETGRIVDTKQKNNYLGPETTGLDVEVNLRMPYVPTSIYHLLNRSDTPLISCRVRNAKAENTTLRVRVMSFIEHFSVRAVETVELKQYGVHSFDQLPTLIPGRVRDLNEMTRATLNILIENLDGKVELHKTEPIWLMARTTALLDYWDPTTQKHSDLRPYLGAFVTPNAPEVMTFVREAAARAPGGQFTSYFADEAAVEGQVRAIFDALTERKLTYVNSWVSFGPDRHSQFHQRARLPRESLKDWQANCIDGTLLFASLLEAVSLSAALVLVPGHAFVAWETRCDINGPGNDQWRFLDTTKIGTESFEKACEIAENQYSHYGPAAQLLKVRELRSRGIFPLE